MWHNLWAGQVGLFSWVVPCVGYKAHIASAPLGIGS